MKRIIMWTAAVLAVCSVVAARAGTEECRVFFTSPRAAHSCRHRGNPQMELVRAINGTTKSFLGAFYDISSREVVDALIKASGRGIDVKLVTDDDNFDRSQVSRLIRSGIPVVCDCRSGLMHNKFAVIDGARIWTGSYNITGNGGRRNNNNAVLIESGALARLYRAEFIEMFDKHVFGNRDDPVPFSGVTRRLGRAHGRGEIRAMFAPEDDIEGTMVKSIDEASVSVYFMAFSFTSDIIGEAVIRAHKRGVRVRGLFEKRGSGSRYSEFVKMKIEGMQVRTDRNPHTMHHKVLIIDGRTVYTGSYNFSKGAGTRNDENVIIIINRDIAGKYIKEFRRLYNRK